MENGYSGVLVWFNDTPMTRVSGSLNSSGEQYVFRTTIPENAAKGSATIKIRAMDAAGNASEVSNSMFVIYPELSKKDLKFVGKGSLESSFGINKVLSKIKDASVTAFLNDDSMTLLSVTPYQSGERYLFKTVVTEQTKEGLATTRLRVKDGANNISEIQTQKIIIDTTPPQISGLSTKTDYRAQGPFTITFTVNEPLSTGLGKSSLDVLFNGSPLTKTSVLYNDGQETYTYRGIIDSSTKEGPSSISIRAEDPAGNTTAVQNNSIVVDLSTPQISHISIEKRFLSEEVFNLQFDVNETLIPGIGQSTISVLFNDKAMSQVSATALKTGGMRYYYQLAIDKKEKQGLANIQIKLTDAAGHYVSKSVDTSEQVIVDTIAPSISIQPESDYLSSGDFAITVSISEDISQQSGKKSIAAWFNKKRMTLVEVKPATTGEVAMLQTKISASEEQGPGTLVVQVTDQSGNSTTSTYNNFIVDTISPIIYGISTEKRRVSSGLLEIGFGINETLTAGVGKTAIRVTFNGENMTPKTTKSDEFGNWHTFTVPITETTPQGDADIKILVSDASGNKATANYPGIIIDSQPAILHELEIIPEPEVIKPVVHPKKKPRRR
jgi:hypothetical protein